MPLVGEEGDEDGGEEGKVPKKAKGVIAPEN
jgi:hypothetical protein